MRLGTFVPLAAAAALLTGCGFSGAGQQPASADVQEARDPAADRRAIERVLAEDAEAGQLQTPDRIANAMRQIDLTQAPDDFRRAYLLHVQDWDRWAEMERSVQNILDTSPATVQRIERQRDELQQQVESSFQRAQQAAAAHGVRLPPQAEPNR